MPWLRYLLTTVVGAAIGIGAAAYTVRAGAFGSNQRIGPWQTGTDFGTKDASARTRAVVALRGLLALPQREARYYTAATDDAGRPLDGRCRYRVSGGLMPGRWWSLTLYDRDGYLVRNAAGVFSVNSAAIAPAERVAWSIPIAPSRTPGHWLPTGGIDRFELTLRTYAPAEPQEGHPTPRPMPAIVREAC